MKLNSVQKRQRNPIIDESGEVLTKQADKNSCDINLMMARYQATGELPHAPYKKPKYGDFSQAQNFQDALDLVQEAEVNFQNLPAKVRAKFKNNPFEVLNFLDNAENLEEAIELGLIEAPKKTPKKDDPDPTGDPDPKKKTKAKAADPGRANDPNDPGED